MTNFVKGRDAAAATGDETRVGVVVVVEVVDVDVVVISAPVVVLTAVAVKRACLANCHFRNNRADISFMVVRQMIGWLI